MREKNSIVRLYNSYSNECTNYYNANTSNLSNNIWVSPFSTLLVWLETELYSNNCFCVYIDFVAYIAVRDSLLEAQSSFISSGRTENDEPYIMYCGFKYICMSKEDEQKYMALI